MDLRQLVSAAATGALVVTATGHLEAPQKAVAGGIVDRRDLERVADIIPTSYWRVDERGYNCSGNYNGIAYSPQERTRILDVKGNEIATICRKFYAELLMEGSGIIERDGRLIRINYDRDINGNPRFKKTICEYGEGKQGRCLIPFYSTAADVSPKTQNHWNIGDIFYVPEIDGILLPDGSRHNGILVVDDTGGRFEASKDLQRVDLFGGSSKNFWDKKGFNHEHKFEAYKVQGQSKARAQKWINQKFRKLRTRR